MAESVSDSVILDWLEENATSIRQLMDERIEVLYLDEFGRPVKAVGKSLRTAVMEAMK